MTRLALARASATGAQNVAAKIQRALLIYKEGGSLRVVTKTFSHVRPSARGKINLIFEPVVNNETVSGIEVLDESGESLVP